MATKNNPGEFDCYENAEPDEPMFILLGRDPMASSLVELWATIREANDEDGRKVAEARECARLMRKWLKNLGKTEKHIIPGVAGDTTQQAWAWTEIYNLCLSLGMTTSTPEHHSGIERVKGFINTLAERAEPFTDTAEV